MSGPPPAFCRGVNDKCLDTFHGRCQGGKKIRYPDKNGKDVQKDCKKIGKHCVYASEAGTHPCLELLQEAIWNLYLEDDGFSRIVKCSVQNNSSCYEQSKILFTRPLAPLLHPRMSVSPIDPSSSSPCSHRPI